MRKFWRIGSKKRIQKRIQWLEEEFIDWSEKVDEELLEFYEEFENHPLDYLRKLYNFYSNSLTEARELDYEYRYLFRYSKESHPNYEKLFWRLDLLLDLIDDEIEERKLESY